MGNYNFRKDLAVSDAEAPEVIKKIKTFFREIKDIQTYKIKEYDMSGIYKNKQLTFEIKNDIMSADTGNVAIEFHSWGKPSGIATTTAKYWIQKICEDHYIIKTDKLKTMIVDKKYFWIVRGKGDKGSNTQMYLFKKDVFISKCKKM